MNSGLSFYQHQKSPCENLKHIDTQCIGDISNNTRFVKFTFACMLWLYVQREPVFYYAAEIQEFLLLFILSLKRCLCGLDKYFLKFSPPFSSFTVSQSLTRLWLQFACMGKCG